jgi:hypothetical protein
MSGSAIVSGSIVNTLAAYLPTAAYDVVGVFDADFNQLFEDARPIAANVKETAKVMEHPAESGYMLADHRVFEPIEIEIPFVLLSQTYVDTYNQVKQVFQGNDTVNVQTNTGLYPNMTISEMPHKEDTEHFDTITMTIKFRQVMIAMPATSSEALPDAPQNGGQKSGNAASGTETTTATENTEKSSAAYSLVPKSWWGGE